MLKIHLSIRKTSNFSVYSKKVNKSLGENNFESDSRKERKLRKAFKKFFKSPKRRKLFKIGLVASLGIGTLLLIYYNPSVSHLATTFISRCRQFFASSDEKSVSSPPLGTTDTSKSHIWGLVGKIGIFLVVLGGAILVRCKQQNQQSTVEIKVDPSIFKTSIAFARQYVPREVVGLVLILGGMAGSVPIMTTSPAVAACLHLVTLITGWQLITHPKQ